MGKRYEFISMYLVLFETLLCDRNVIGIDQQRVTFQRHDVIFYKKKK